MRCLFFLIIALVAATTNADAQGLFGHTTPDNECEVQRDDAYACAKNYSDLNHDGRIEKNEVIYFRNFVLYWWERALVWAVNETPEKIMDRCAEKPHKKYITVASYKEYTWDCLRHCYDWRTAMKMCRRMDALPKHDLKAYFRDYEPWLREQASGSGSSSSANDGGK